MSKKAKSLHWQVFIYNRSTQLFLVQSMMHHNMELTLFYCTLLYVIFVLLFVCALTRCIFLLVKICFFRLWASQMYNKL